MKIKNNNTRLVILRLTTGDELVVPPWGIVDVNEMDVGELPVGLYVLESKVLKEEG